MRKAWQARETFHHKYLFYVQAAGKKKQKYSTFTLLIFKNNKICLSDKCFTLLRVFCTMAGSNTTKALLFGLQLINLATSGNYQSSNIRRFPRIEEYKGLLSAKLNTVKSNETKPHTRPWPIIIKFTDHQYEEKILKVLREKKGHSKRIMGGAWVA